MRASGLHTGASAAAQHAGARNVGIHQEVPRGESTGEAGTEQEYFRSQAHLARKLKAARDSGCRETGFKAGSLLFRGGGQQTRRHCQWKRTLPLTVPKRSSPGESTGEVKRQSSGGETQQEASLWFPWEGQSQAGKPASGTTSLALGRRSPADCYQAGVPEHGSLITGCEEGLLGGPVARNPPCNARDVGLTLHQGTKIPNTVEQLKPHAVTREPGKVPDEATKTLWASAKSQSNKSSYS